MAKKSNINPDQIREAIDAVDDQLLQLFQKRMTLAKDMAEYKTESNAPIYNKEREDAIIANVVNQLQQNEKNQLTHLSHEGKAFFERLMTASRRLQYRQITGREPIDYGLVGKSLPYSFSKEIHQMMALYDYHLCEMTPKELKILLESRCFKGLNVTIPYKKSVIPFVDVLDKSAAAIGSVNTLYFKDNRLHGANTDYVGFLWMVQKSGISFTGKKVLVAGTGGASLTVQRAAAHLGADEILTVSRKDPITYDKIPQDIEIYINATPVGTFPHNGQCNVSLAEFPKLEGVLDLVYNPGKTALLLQAEKQGISFSGGLPMLIAQATASVKLFLDNSHLLLDNETILNAVEKKTRNITLIGMPGCGKSTIGRRLAKFLHMKFVDTDALIERKAAMTPSEIITQKGEKAFRDLESTVIKKIGKRHGQVIAVGGGAILREENRDALRQNGPVVYIRRSVDKLSTYNRPLSSDLQELYEKRHPLYTVCSDFSVKNDAHFSRAFKLILQRLT